MSRRQQGFTLVELMIVVAIIGILAAIAIPSFLRYIQKARTAEAVQQVEKISNAARAYFLEDRTAALDGSLIPPQFPVTVAPTPAVTSCALGSPRYTPSPLEWNDPTWQALHFGMYEPHYYRYEFVSSGTSVDSEFTVRAFGNLDCDLIESTFTRGGTVQELGLDMTSSGSTVKINELE